MNRVVDDPLAVVEDEFRYVAKKFGIQQCDEIASELVNRLTENLGGASFYFPTISAVKRRARNEEMRQKFNGRNLHELAREYGMTVRHAHRIVNSRDGGTR